MGVPCELLPLQHPTCGASSASRRESSGSDKNSPQLMTRALIAKVTVQQEGHPSEQQGSVGEKEEQQQLDFAASSSGRGEVVLWVPVRA